MRGDPFYEFHAKRADRAEEESKRLRAEIERLKVDLLSTGLHYGAEVKKREQAERERDEARAIADDDAIVMRSRCPSCGHRIRADMLSSSCPQCFHQFKHDWHYNLNGDYPEDCECDRCDAARGECRMRDPQFFSKEEHEATEPDAFCDSCEAPMWERNGEYCGTTFAYGIETVACRKCRGGDCG